MKLLDCRPIGPRVLVRTDPREEKSAGGVIMPHVAREKQRTATVIAVSAGWWEKRGEREVWCRPDEGVKPGAKVFLAQHAHDQGRKNFAEPYSDKGVLMLIQYDWIAGLLEEA